MHTILITGAAKRIGRQIALAMAKTHKVIIHYNQSSHEAEELVRLINDNGGIARSIQQDLYASNAGQKLFENVLKIFNDIDIIINSASIFLPDNIENMSETLWKQHQDIHVNIPLKLTQMLYQYTLNHKSQALNKNIINIIDQRIKRPTPAFFSYTASKMFLGTLTKQCAIACSPLVRVNAIAPGSTLPSIRQTQDEFNQQAALNPLEKPIEIDEIINAINFIINSTSITGEIITIDAGQNLDWRTSSYLNCKE